MNPLVRELPDNAVERVARKLSGAATSRGVRLRDLRTPLAEAAIAEVLAMLTEADSDGPGAVPA